MLEYPARHNQVKVKILHKYFIERSKLQSHFKYIKWKETFIYIGTYYSTDKTLVFFLNHNN